MAVVAPHIAIAVAIGAFISAPWGTGTEGSIGSLTPRVDTILLCLKAVICVVHVALTVVLPS